MDRQKLVGTWYCDSSRFRIEVVEYKTGRLEGTFGAQIFENGGDGVYRLAARPEIATYPNAQDALAAAENTVRNELAVRSVAASETDRTPLLATLAFQFAKKWAALLLLIVVLIPVTFSPPYSNSPPIRSDGIGYHLWTRAILDGDLSMCKWNEAGWVFSSRDDVRGICRNKYPPGLALLRLPVMAFLVNRRVAQPLISPAEHTASLFVGALALALVCWLVMASSYILKAPVWAANFAVLVYLFGAGLFHYGTYDSCFTHVYSALGFSLMVWQWLRSAAAGRPPLPWTFALICFFLVAIRGTNLIGIAFLLPVCVLPRRRVKQWKMPGIGWRVGAAACAGVLLAVVLPMAYNYYATRQFSFSTYGDEGFLFDRPMQWPVMFSYQRGLFTYYPIVAVGIAAGLWAQRTRAATCWLMALLAAMVVVYGFWPTWYLGGGMGHRGFVELMPFAAVLMAIALPALPLRGRAPMMALGAAAALVTFEIMCGYWAGTYPFENATSTVFWEHVVGKRSLLPFHSRA